MELCSTRNIEVTGIDRAIPKEGTVTRVDIRSAEIKNAIPKEADALIHLAAISRDEDCRRDPHSTFDINVLGTLNLLRAARERGVRQFIFASSEWVYGEVGNGQVQTEDQAIDVMRIHSVYALSKIVCEQNLRLAYQPDLCSVTILRFGIVYGPRPSPGSAVESLFNQVSQQEAVSVGSLATARRFIHVSDIAEGILSAIGQKGFEIFNLSGDALITLQDIINESADLLQRHPQIIEKDPGNRSIRNPDNRKAKRMLGWKPTLDLRHGLESLLTNQTARK